jgi:hypothetical protein
VVIAKREKHILIALAIVVFTAVLYMYVVEPYFDTADQISAGRMKLQSDLDEDHAVFQELKVKLPEWEAMKKNGLLDNSELVESQTIGAILAWSELAGVDVKGTRTGRPSKDGNFIIITYDFNLEAPMASLSRLLWALEKSPIPLRISDLTITPVHEGVDDLNVRMQVSALSRAPTADNAPSRASTAAPAVHAGT